MKQDLLSQSEQKPIDQEMSIHHSSSSHRSAMELVGAPAPPDTMKEQSRHELLVCHSRIRFTVII